MAITEFRGKYYFLCNPSPCKLVFDGVEYTCTESAFQAQKSLDPFTKQLFSANPVDEAGNNLPVMTWGCAKRLGNLIPLRPFWDAIKVDIMLEVVRAKFEQNEDLAEKLLATKGHDLVEGNRWHDIEWGKCICLNHNGQGENYLGKILMKVRKELDK